MSETNPYTAPTSDITVPAPPFDPNQIQLASLSDRFAGAFIDGLIGLVASIPIWGVLFLTGVVTFKTMGTLGFGYILAMSLVGYAIFIAIHWKFLNATGQTIGKKVMNTRIVTMDGKKPEIKDLLIKRYGFTQLISIIPVVGTWIVLVSVLLIFKKDRRCLHDLIAGTQVIKFPKGSTIS